MKVIVVGCTHAGTSAVKTILKENPGTEVTVYERNDNVSFLSCGIALYVGGVVKREADVLYLALFFQLERVLIGVHHLFIF
mgnify:CR=1 FL=1